MTAALERIEANARQLMRQYATSEQLLADSMKEATSWVMPLVMRKSTPSLPQLERLATQMLAIILASEEPGDE